MSSSPAEAFEKPSLAHLIELGAFDRARRYFRGYWPAVERVYLTSGGIERDRPSHAMAIQFSAWAMSRMDLVAGMCERFQEECEAWIPGLRGVFVENNLGKMFGPEYAGQFLQLCDVLFDGEAC